MTVVCRSGVVTITDMEVDCRVGEKAPERDAEQVVVLSIRMTLAKPDAQADNLEATVDYKKIYEDVRAMFRERTFVTMERLADAVARLCLDDLRLKEVWVMAQKPKKVSGTGPLGVEWTLARDVAKPALSLLVLVCEDVAATQAFYEIIGLTFTEERHGRGPRHQVSTNLGFVLELYPRLAGEDEAIVDQRRLGIKVPHYAQVVAALDAKKVRHKGKDRGAVFVDPDGRVVVIEPL